MAIGTVIYKCSCGKYHPWSFDGDCTDDANSYSSPEEYAEENDLDPDDLEVRAIDAENGEGDGDDDDDDDGDDDEDDDYEEEDEPNEDDEEE